MSTQNQTLVSPCLSTAGVPLKQVARHVVTIDASRTGWGAVFNKCVASGSHLENTESRSSSILRVRCGGVVRCQA